MGVVRLCARCMQRILPEQHLLEDEESWQGILKYIPDADLRAKLHGRWSSGRQVIEGDINTFRWLDLVSEVDKVLPPVSELYDCMLLSSVLCMGVLHSLACCT